MTGWFAMSRDILDHAIFKGRPDRLYAWVWMLSNAAYRDTQHDVGGVIVDVPRGSLCASQATIQAGTGMSRQALRTFLELLKSANAISLKPATNATKAKTIVTICNYDKYQTAQPSEKPTSNQAATNEQPIKVTRKQINNNNMAKIQMDFGVCSFDDFWAEVPRKVARAGAEKAFEKAVKKVDPETLIAKMRDYTSHVRRMGTEDRHILHPATWLNGERWNDQLSTPYGATTATVDDDQRLRNVAKAIRMGIASAVTPSQAAECIRAGLVTEADCKKLGVL